MLLFCTICMFLYILGGDTAPNISVPCKFFKVSRHNSELRNGPWGLSHAKKKTSIPSASLGSDVIISIKQVAT